VTVKVAQQLPSRLSRAAYCSSLAALLIFFGCEILQNATAEGETRTISLHHIHTNEDLTITYKVNGRYDETALNKIDTVLRDWREDKSVRMDPHLIDLLWEVQREVGAKGPIWIVCGYRSPSTNASLRRRSSGVAKSSQHMNGKAIDFFIPGVPLDRLRAAGLRAQRGGVGFYPTSGSPFVHLDTGNVRHWPRMPEAQLAAVLANGPLSSRVASDARGSAFARGEIQNPARKPGLLAKLFSRSKDEDDETDAAAAGAPEPTRVIASAVAANVEPASEPALEKALDKPAARASELHNVKMAAVPLPVAKPLKAQQPAQGYQVASISSVPVAKIEANKETADEVAPAKSVPAPAASEIASASSTPVRLAQAGAPVNAGSGTANDVINGRGYWQGLPSAERVETPPPSNARVMPASAPTAHRPGAAAAPTRAAKWPLADGSANEPLPNALSYASQPTPIATARALPMGAVAPRAPPAAHAGDTTVVVKRSDDRVPESAANSEEPYSSPSFNKFGSSVVRVGDRFNDPWMRAMIVSPSAQSFMKTTLFGIQDFRNLGAQMQKPDTALALTFTEDPLSGMGTEKFGGAAVSFVSSVKFGASRK